MSAPERRVARPELGPEAYLLTAAFVAGLAPSVWLLVQQGWLSAEFQQLSADVPATSQLTWIVSEPGLAAQRLLTVVGLRFDALPPLSAMISIVCAGVVLAATALTRSSEGRRQPAMVLLAAALGTSPLFLQPVLEANPWFWGAAVWYGCIRALCRVEASASLQMEMALGFGLAMLVLVEPAAPAVVLSVALLLPLVLVRQPDRSAVSALSLILSPPAMVLVAQFASHLLHEQSVWAASSQWTGGQAWLPASVLSGAPPAPLDRVSGFLPWMLSPAILLTPLLPWLAGLGTDWRIRNRAASLLVVLAVPLLVGSLMSWRLGTPVYRPWLLYLLLGQAAWLAETYVPARRYRLLVICFAIWTALAMVAGLHLR